MARVCPTLTPSIEEMADFEGYISSIESLIRPYGMAKVVPPKNWVGRKNGYSNLNIEITHPIRQEVQGLAGLYSVLLISQKPMTLKSYRRYNQTRNNPEPDLSEEEIERLVLYKQFWKHIRYDPPIYGADSFNETLFDRNSLWNLSRLSTTLEEILFSKGLQKELPGINLPFLYFGCWKSMFCWHTEDFDLASINYLHFGSPKFWYCVPPAYADEFKRFCEFHYHENFSQCSEFLRHKNSMISPNLLKNEGIPVKKIVENPGEFIVILPRAFHSGFNAGFNCAEAVNFATPS